MKITWSLKKFEELTPHELYSIMQLRNEVFVVEQNCAYQDADNKDLFSFHFMGWADNKLVAYTRIIPPGISYEAASIGRVVSSPSVRGDGIGRELMLQSISQLYSLFGNVVIKIGAQLYLQKFYTSLGFIQSGDVYLEDGIEHIEMTK
ncbi:GNAT family N-acetyltransferase [Chitinophagaceae bacterium IBVUCB2]|nr:GNAT family N-acetyltransferase [Chitinophagaceae bacterium IBVUCB2]